MKPLVIGRGLILLMLERLIEQMHVSIDIRFERVRDYVQRWKQRNPLNEWSQRNPHYTGANAYRPPSAPVG